ncbi:MAG: aminodeoxychorismate/anthranilate synthase component II [Lentisphaeraceae bacterium]|nr:aminodeoxychorismate/anthranilate synthase component II [Lentisphaeraceae bacterium]
MIFVLDNYDSFTYNLVHLLYALGAEVTIRRNREVTPAEVLALQPDGILLSPGPSSPERAGILCDLVRAGAEARVPMFGVCLGHQAIGHVFGARVVHAKTVMHGKISEVTHDGRGVFEGVPNPFRAVRYHSLALEAASIPACLEVTAHTADGEVMGIRHRELPIEGIQYHPESILTEAGKLQLANFVRSCRHV